MTLIQIWRGWTSFWFAPQAPTPLALVRTLDGLLLLQFGFFIYPELHTWLGGKGIVSPHTVAAVNQFPRLNLLKWLPPGDFGLDCLFWIFIVASLCLALGLFTRASNVVVCLCLASFDAQNPLIFGASDFVLRTINFLLVFSPAGRTISLDRLIEVWAARELKVGPVAPSSQWALRLVQVYMAMLYWTAFTRKLQGQTWVDGTAIYYATRLTELKRLVVPYVFDHLWTCRLASWSTLVIEFCLFTLIWVREFRIPLILLAIAFHLIMDQVLFLPQFQMVMIMGLMSFVEPSTLSKIKSCLQATVRKSFGRPLQVFYDATFDLSLRLAETIRRLDFLGLVDLREAQCLSGQERDSLSWPEGTRPGVFVLIDGRWYGGMQAVKALSLRLPLLVVIYPAVCLPTSNALLSRVWSGLLSVYAKRFDRQGVS